MANDRELLELAAKTLELNLYKADSNDGGGFYLYKDTPSGNKELTAWNPLEEDGDCARMEADVGINLEWGTDFVCAIDLDGNEVCEYFKDHNGDKQAARRMASLRVASDIGRAMQSDKR